MEEAHRKLLQKNRVTLARDLDVKTATSYLYSQSILSENDKDTIESQTTPLGKNESLLDILPKRGPEAFGVFLKCLEVNNQTHLLRLLKPVAEELKSPIEASVSPLPEGKPAAETDPYNFSTNPRSVSSTFPTPVSNSQATTSFPDGQTTSTIDTQIGGISSTSDMANNHGVDQGDGNSSSHLNPPNESYRDGVSKQDIYPMYNKPRGQAFIINNKIFKPASGMQKYPRNGTDVDAEALLRLFRGLGFETVLYHDQTSKETSVIVERYANMDHSRYDCFMCAVLTHGEEGLIYSTDGKIPLKEFTSKFRTRRLLGKPKLFFFQACQGFDYMEGADQPDGPAEPDVDEVDAPGQNKITLPLEADFLYAYSTVPGYYSWRNSVRGSWFAQAIVSVFTRYATTMDVMRMLTRVNAEVSKQKSNTNDYYSDNKKQIPSVISQLRKELYFFPENVVGQQ